MNKKLKIIIPAIVVVIVAIVGVLLVVNNNQAEQVKETTTEVVKTTLKEDKTTISEKETSETETETSTETTKRPITNSLGNSGGSSTTTPKPTTTAPTTQKQEITTQNSITSNTTTVNQTESVDISVVGNIKYGDMARAGLYYDKEGKLTTYDKIEHGDYYYHYDSCGDRAYIKKPVKNPDAPDFNCQYCGKSTLDRWDKFANCTKACAVGGCTRWTSDVTCQYCGIFVTANTCHTCQ